MPWLSQDRHRLASFRLGERVTLAEVYSHYAPELGRALSRGTVMDGSHEGRRLPRVQGRDLEDVLQDTFVRAFAPAARASFDGLRPYGTYLISVARNALIDQHRKRQREERTGAQLFTSERLEAVEGPGPERAVLDREANRIYQDFVASLGEPDRTLLGMRLEQDVSRRLVTERTGLSAMQVRWREAKLRRALHALLVSSGYSLRPLEEGS